MAINFYNSPESSQWLTDATNTATLPVTGELFTAGHVDRIADEVSAIQYALGMPGLRGTAGPVWGTNATITTGLATSSVTSVVFASDVSAVLTAGMLIAGAAPTTTGWRRITAVSTFTVTVNAAFDSNLASEYAIQHGNVSRRIALVEAQIADNVQIGNYGFEFANAADTDHDITVTIYTDTGSTSTITKQMDATWVEGTNQGGMESGQSLPTSGVVKWIVITKDADPTVIDIIGTPRTTLSDLVVPTGWSKKCAFDVFRMVTDSSANFPTFTHNLFAGVVLLTGTLALDLNVSDQGTTRTTRQAINVPDRVVALRRSYAACASSHESKVEALIHTDQAPTRSAAALADHWSDSGYSSAGYVLGSSPVYIDASRNYATDSTQANTTLYVQFYGWFWRAV